MHLRCISNALRDYDSLGNALFPYALFSYALFLICIILVCIQNTHIEYGIYVVRSIAYIIHMLILHFHIQLPIYCNATVTNCNRLRDPEMSHGFQGNSGMVPLMKSTMHSEMHCRMHLGFLKCISNALWGSQMHLKCI